MENDSRQTAHGGTGKPAGTSPATPYSTFPETATHGPRDKRCFHGKPGDWARNRVQRTFGGKTR